MFEKECHLKDCCDNYEIECYHCSNNYEKLKNYHIYLHCGVPGLLCKDCNPRDCNYKNVDKSNKIYV